MSNSALIIDIVQLHQKQGSKRDITVTLQSGERGAKIFDELLLEGSEIQCGTIEASLELESRSVQVNVNGDIAIGWSGPCRRCLEATSGTQNVSVAEIFHVHPIEGETYPLGEHELDLTPMVREVVLLNLPLNPLCDSQCPGPAPKRFPTKTQVDSEELPPVDPRWGPLSELKFD